ncbi:MAG: GIY-YIG nuclease family protein [Proteobacteria bacterium]|nr:GIY-YIG nuclease family protein [Pseudomonadota bacterium]
MRDKGNKRYCAYAIQSKVTGRIYIGQTDCLERRIQEHNHERAKSTRREGPWIVVATEFFLEESKARWLESCLKRSRGKRLEWLDKHKV